jgi:hypothetical protein
VICVAEGTYAEEVVPGTKYFTLAGGFQSGQSFRVRDSAQYVSRAMGDRTNVFIHYIDDDAPSADQATIIDGFEITNYSQAIVRTASFNGRFDVTNNNIHDNVCSSMTMLVGAGICLDDVTGTISGNVITGNRCGRGGAIAIFDSTHSNTVSVLNNRVVGNSGEEPEIAHGGGVYLLVQNATVTGNEIADNTAVAWGGGLYVGGDPPRGLVPTVRTSWNVIHGNRAPANGGGFFCDDGARCISEHDIFYENCGGNIFGDSGTDETTPTVATFDHLTAYRGLSADCTEAGAGVIINKENAAADRYSFTNAIFWGNGADLDFAAACDTGCANISVSVTYSLVQTDYANGGVTVAFGEGNIASADPLFGDPSGDFHLRSTFGRWTPSGYVMDPQSSPALRAADPASLSNDNPARAGTRNELGAYGNSPEAAYTQ